MLMWVFVACDKTFRLRFRKKKTTGVGQKAENESKTKNILSKDAMNIHQNKKHPCSTFNRVPTGYQKEPGTNERTRHETQHEEGKKMLLLHVQGIAKKQALCVVS